MKDFAGMRGANASNGSAWASSTVMGMMKVILATQIF